MSRSTSKTLMVVTLARISLLGIWFIGNILLMKKLGPTEFGIFALAVMYIKLVTGCLGDALDLSVMRRVPVIMHEDRGHALEIVRSSFWLRTSMGIGIFAVLFSAQLPLSKLMLGGAQNHQVVVLIGIGILSDMLCKSSLGLLQACEQFVRLVFIESLLQIGRFLGVIILIYTGHLTAINAVLLFSIAPLIVFIFSLPWLPRDIVAMKLAPMREILSMVKYAKWIVISMAMASIYERIDLLMLGKYRMAADVGLYSAGLTLATIPDHFTGCLTTVLQPRIPVLYSRGQYLRFTRKYFLIALPFVVLGLLGTWFLGGPVIDKFLSSKYHGSILIFQILASYSIVGVMLAPLAGSLVAFLSPKYLTLQTAIALLLALFGAYALIPSYGPLGAALLMVSIRSFNVMLANCYALYLAIQQMHRLNLPVAPIDIPVEGNPA